jgi:hypothetical protein
MRSFFSLIFDIWAIVRVAKLLRRAFLPVCLALVFLTLLMALSSHLVAALLVFLISGAFHCLFGLLGYL